MTVRDALSGDMHDNTRVTPSVELYLNYRAGFRIDQAYLDSQDVDTVLEFYALHAEFSASGDTPDAKSDE